MNDRQRAVLIPLIAILPALVLLCGLGIWQLERKQEKEALIAAIATRSNPPALKLWREAQWAGLLGPDIIFQRVTAAGSFLPEPTFRLYALREDAPGRARAEAGWYVLTPFRLRDGGLVIVNRGFIEAHAPLPPPLAGEIVIEALVRPGEKPGWFAAEDDSKTNSWYTRDPGKMAKSAGLAAVAPFMLDEVTPELPGRLRLDKKPPALPNRHLEYALTWFALALTLGAVGAVFIAGRLKRGLTRH